MRACTLEQLRDDVDADHFRDERCECKCERACAGADVERPLVATSDDERRQLLADELDLPLGVLGDAGGGRAEPRAHFVDVRSVRPCLRHRSRPAARAAGSSRSRTRSRS